MIMRALLVSIAVAVAFFICAPNAIACPCNPCTCSPCACGGMNKSSKSKPAKTASSKPQTSKTEHGKPTTSKTGKSESHHKGKEGHGGHSSHTEFGVGVDIDLSGIGQRRAEPDPFAVSGPPPPPRTQVRTEKPKTKEKQHDITRPDPFTNVSLTGPQAKEESEPPGPVNVSDDNEATPTLPTQEVFHAPTMDDLKKAKDAYGTAEKKFLDNDPEYQAAWKQYKDNVGTAGPGTTAEKKAQKAFIKMKKRKDHFAQSDEGKKLFDDWMKKYQALNKPGTDMPDDLVPPDKREKAKHNLMQAENALKTEREVYDEWTKDAVSKHDGVKKIQADIDGLKTKTHFSEADAQADREKLKQLEADLENARKQAAKQWAESDGAKNQMKKVQQAEKALNEAKDAYKHYEQFEEKPKAASNP